MGGAIVSPPLAYRNQVFNEMSRTIFESLRRDSAVWLKDRLIIKVADILARSKVEKADTVEYTLSELWRGFKGFYEKSAQVLKQSLPEETFVS